MVVTADGVQWVVLRVSISGSGCLANASGSCCRSKKEEKEKNANEPAVQAIHYTIN